MSKHTSGPWQYMKYAGSFTLQHKDGHKIHDDLLSMDMCRNAEDNAILAAEAPELLNCLEQLIENVCNIPDIKYLLVMDMILTRSKAAIAKTTGK